MLYRKIKVSSAICPDRFYRVMYVDENQSLFRIGVEILIALQSEFEHMFLWMDRDRMYVDSSWLEEPFNGREPVDYKKFTLKDTCLFSDNTLTFEYDTGESWMFQVKVYKETKEIESEIGAVVTEAVGDKIWEDCRYAFEHYIFNIPYREDENPEEYFPWNLMGDSLESFDEEIKPEFLNELLEETDGIIEEVFDAYNDIEIIDDRDPGLYVLIVNGSPHSDGNTVAAIREMATVFGQCGVKYDVLEIGTQNIRGCIACNKCASTGKCVFNDPVNTAAPLFEKADGLVIASPVYYASANATLVAFLQRLFYSTSFDKTMKVGASIAAARRGGLTATYDELNKFFGISGMPIASGQYWNGIHGRIAGEAYEDKEGLQMMRTLAKNMVFLMRSIQLGKSHYGLPEKEKHIATNFVRDKKKK